ERNFPLANSLWEELCGDSREGLEAYEQLAIYYEHHARDSGRAAELTRVALRSLAQAARTGDLEPGRIRRWRHRLEHRLARLCSKSRGPLFERTVPEARRGRGESNAGSTKV